jgi:putative ABC transport system substrate-binding protein
MIADQNGAAVMQGKPLSLKTAALLLGIIAVLGSADGINAQRTKTYRIGIIRQGGPDSAAVQGLKNGLKDLGFIEGKQYVVEDRDLKGDGSTIRAAAESLERGQVDLIYSIATSVTIAAKRATTSVPIVFAIGTDPVSAGLVETFAKPGGRLTGVNYLTTDTTAKRLQILKAMVPKLRKIAIFYDPGNEAATRALKSAYGAASQLDIGIVEIPVTSIQELRARVAAFKPQDADAFFYINDAMVRSEARLISATMRDKKVPTMFSFPGIAVQGALAGYGVSLRDVGERSSRYVQNVLAGAHPGDLAVESISRVELVLNAKTARQIGITIPEAVRLSATEIVE